MQIVKDINRVAVMQNGEIDWVEGLGFGYLHQSMNNWLQDFITTATGHWSYVVKIDQQKIVQNLPADSVLAHLKYAGTVTDTAIINDIYKAVSVSANILHANIEILDNAVGEMVVILSGNAETVSAQTIYKLLA